MLRYLGLCRFDFVCSCKNLSLVSHLNFMAPTWFPTSQTAELAIVINKGERVCGHLTLALKANRDLLNLSQEGRQVSNSSLRSEVSLHKGSGMLLFCTMLIITG